jgi:HD-GYP domain-containing protein (c-di-GMP phosphodiesterase class II)
MLSIIAGAAAGVLLVRERSARRLAERVAAASLETLLNAIDANDAETGAHVRRVAAYALVIADALQVGKRERREIERAALFHDIGKIHEALFDIVHEQGQLSDEEFEAIRTHPARGADVLEPLVAFYPQLPDVVLTHHERWDGTGYPIGLRGDEIPFVTRIVSIADAFDAITHNRRYKSGHSAEEAAVKLAEGRGSQFDPALVDLVLSPPVFHCLIGAHRELHRVRGRGAERRTPDPERHVAPVPEVTFRWRTPGQGSTAVEGDGQGSAAR